MLVEISASRGILGLFWSYQDLSRTSYGEEKNLTRIPGAKFFGGHDRFLFVGSGSNLHILTLSLESGEIINSEVLSVPSEIVSLTCTSGWISVVVLGCIDNSVFKLLLPSDNMESDFSTFLSPVLPPSSERLYKSVQSNSNRFIVSAFASGRCVLSTIESNEILLEFKIDLIDIVALLWSPEDNLLFLGSSSGEVAVFDVSMCMNGQIEYVDSFSCGVGIRSFVMRPTNSNILFICVDAPEIQAWDIRGCLRVTVPTTQLASNAVLGVNRPSGDAVAFGFDNGLISIRTYDGLGAK